MDDPIFAALLPGISFDKTKLPKNALLHFPGGGELFLENIISLSGQIIVRSERCGGG